MSELRDFISGYWLRATDDYGDLTDEQAALVELGYRLGFANALQAVGQSNGDRDVKRAIREAVALLDLPEPPR